MSTAKTLYDSQKFEEALKELQNQPHEDAIYYYNLGTLQFRLNHIGTAVAYFEKASRLSADDPDIQHNLSVSRAKLSETVGYEKLDPASHWFEKLADGISLNKTKTGLSSLALLSVFLLLIAYLRTRKLRDALGRATGTAGLTLLAITLILGCLKLWADLYPPAFCIDHLVIRSGPGSSYFQLAEAEAGTKLRIINRMPAEQNAVQWVQVRYEADKIGWVKASDLLTLQ